MVTFTLAVFIHVNSYLMTFVIRFTAVTTTSLTNLNSFLGFIALLTRTTGVVHLRFLFSTNLTIATIEISCAQH